MPDELPMNIRDWDRVFQINNEQDFLKIALEVFAFQYSQNPLYRRYADALGRTPGNVVSLETIPFLPISFFRDREVLTTDAEVKLVFESSSTTSTRPGRHFLISPELYVRSFREGFRRVYGDPKQYCILALLPSYLERENSSLVYMVRDLIETSGQRESGFYLKHQGDLIAVLKKLGDEGRKALLIGVSFALLDFASANPIHLGSTIVMDTGGMKGRKTEMIREEFHGILRSAFGIDSVHSEYGMTELLSQAYARDGQFQTPPWMKVLFRDETDPLTMSRQGSGAMNIIDLANIYSCSFIASQDLGRGDEKQFEVLGRMDHTDMRGCSLMAL